MSKINLTKHTPGPWIVKQPGEHGKGLRVVHPIGITMDNGKEVFGGVADILTTRTSANNMSDVTEQANAELIASAPTLLAQNARLRAALEAALAAEAEMAAIEDCEENSWTVAARAALANLDRGDRANPR